MTVLTANSYEIKLPQFEGPFDLLLFFIERDELDIYDIPIAGITKDFLEYVHQMKTLNVDLASEFILVAATLMRIKAKMLLPRKELDEEGNEIDPREDLVQALLEYKRYKGVVDELKALETQRQMTHPRRVSQGELRHIADAFETETDLSNLTLYKLMRTFQRVLDRIESRRETLSHQVVPYPYTTDDCKEDLLTRLARHPRLDFEKAFEAVKDRVHAVFLFLAMLDLAQQGMMKIQIGIGFNNFWIESVPQAAEA
jgi:segregation and condensation protein A